MYSVFTILFILAALMITVGFIGRVGVNGLNEVDANVAAAIGLIFVYALIFVSFSNFSDLLPIFDKICGGIPFLDKIADYGSLQNVLHADPMGAAVSFLDTVILATMINVLSLLPLSQGNAAGRFMVRIFTGVVLALISLLILNFVIKGSTVYQWILAVIAGVISLISIGTIPIQIMSVISNHAIAGVGALGAAQLFAQSEAAGIFRTSFLEALVYVLGIYLLESRFGSVGAAMSRISVFLVAFGPVVVILIGIGLILRSVFSR